MVGKRVGESRAAGHLRRDPPYESSPEGAAGQQERPYDARGIAQMMRVGLYNPVHVKTLASQQQRMRPPSRKLLRDKLQDMENELRGTLRNFGLKGGVVSPGHFEARITELVA